MYVGGFRRRCGFTILEVLTVITIIAILMALLLPGLSASRQRAKGTYCLNRLKEIGLAASAYATDYAERLPPAAISWHPTQVARVRSGEVSPCDIVGYGWAELLYEHMNSTETVTDWAHFPAQRNFQGKYQGFYNCPSAQSTQDHAGHYRVYLTGWANEVYTLDQDGRLANPREAPNIFAPRLSNLKPRLPLIGDSNEYSNFGDNEGSAEIPIPGCMYGACPANESSWIGVGFTPDQHPYSEANMTMIHCEHAPESANSFAHRHSGGANYLFGDFHAAFDKGLRERLACDWDLNGVHDPVFPSSREWSNCPHEPERIKHHE